MNDEDPKDLGHTPEKVPTKNLRRRFLAGSTAAAVGMVATAIAPKEAGAAIVDSTGSTIGPLSYHPNEGLAKIIVKAWEDDSFKQELLTYPDLKTKEDWEKKGDIKPDNKKLKEVLETFDIFIDNPIVLTCPQYEWGYKKLHHEVVFVMPDGPNDAKKIAKTKNLIHTARIAMIYCPFGM